VRSATSPGVISEMIQPIIPAVLAARGQPGDLLDAAVRANARRVAARLKTQSPVLQEAQRQNGLKRTFAGYRGGTGEGPPIGACVATQIGRRRRRRLLPAW
jgi:carbonic anhydrase